MMAGPCVAETQWYPPSPAFQTGFPVSIGSAAFIRYSSVSLGDLDADGLPEIVVGTSDGRVVAYDGNGTRLWTYPAEGALTSAIESKAAIADVDADGNAEVVIGVGSTFSPNGAGSVLVLDHLGGLQCAFSPRDTYVNGLPDGVFSSPAVANLDGSPDGRLEIVFGSWDMYVYAIRDDCSLYWEKFVRDTVWSSPAIADLDRDGNLEVIIGVDSHAEGTPYNTGDGGVLHAYRHDGVGEAAGFPIQIDEVIWSSPVVGDIDGDGWYEIVVGTGHCWDVPGCAPTTVHPGVGEYINAWNHDGSVVAGWPFQVPGEYAFASPALADLDGDGLDEVVINTVDKTTGGGVVYALNHDGSLVTGWPAIPSTPATCDTQVHFGTWASPVVADLTGDGEMEVLLPSNWEVVIWDHAGEQVSRDDACPEPAGDFVLVTDYTVNSSVAVGDLDGDHDLEVVVAGGASGGSAGALYVWDFPGKDHLTATPWPQFRRWADGRATVLELFIDDFEGNSLDRWSAAVGDL